MESPNHTVPAQSRQGSITLTIPYTPETPSSSRKPVLKSLLTSRRKSRQARRASEPLEDSEGRPPICQESSPFLARLPYEVRELIYLHLLQKDYTSGDRLQEGDDGILLSMESKQNSKWKSFVKGDALLPLANSSDKSRKHRTPHIGRVTFTRLLRTCRHIYNEAQPLLYAHTPVIAPSLMVFLNFTTRIPCSSLLSIRNMELRVSFPWLLFPRADDMRVRARDQLQHFNTDEWFATWAMLGRMATPGHGHLRHLTVQIKARAWSANANWPIEPIPEVRERLFAPLKEVTDLEKQNFVVEVSWRIDHGELPLPPTLNPETGEVVEIKRGEAAWWRAEDVPFTLREFRKEIARSRGTMQELTQAMFDDMGVPREHGLALTATQTPLTPANTAVTMGEMDDFDIESDAISVARAVYQYIPDPMGVDAEIGFAKGELLRIRRDVAHLWWQAKNEAGEVGLVPSNYLVVLDDNQIAELRRMGVAGLPPLSSDVMQRRANGVQPAPVARQRQGYLDRMGNAGWGWA